MHSCLTCGNFILIGSQANKVELKLIYPIVYPWILLGPILWLKYFEFEIFENIHWLKLHRTNIRIYSEGKKHVEWIWLVKMIQIFSLMNIFVIRYSNMFEYPNIRYTLWPPPPSGTFVRKCFPQTRAAKNFCWCR